MEKQGDVLLMEYRLLSTDLLLSEIGSVIANAVDNGRDQLNQNETEFIIRITKRMVKECRIHLAHIPNLLPEEIPEEIVEEILKETPIASTEFTWESR